MLIFDVYSYHITLEFNCYCQEYVIIVLYMLSYLSHILQSLNIKCFSILKWLYMQQVEQLIGINVSYIDKWEFLQLYQQVCLKVLYSTNIQSSFAATILVSYNSNHVLALIYMKMHILLSKCRFQTAGLWKAETSHNVIELQYQMKLIK